ncbi:MAG: YhfC family intramembrane metalloprotease [Oscillospiraceae bacterium]
MFGSEVITALVTGAVLGFLIPIAALVVYKLKYRNASLLSAALGAVTFMVFALMLEQLMHAFMLPLVMESDIAYIIYGTLAAGIFEETGRLVVCKFLMKNRTDNVNAVMLGIGHGGIEAVILMGMIMMPYLITVLSVNAMGFDEFAKTAGATTQELVDTLRAQLETVERCDIPLILLSALERVIAMTLHISMSVVVMKAVTVPGKLWLYPVAILMHAMFDLPAAMYQRGIISQMWILELLLAVFVAFAVFFAIKVSRLGQRDTAAV